MATAEKKLTKRQQQFKALLETLPETVTAKDAVETLKKALASHSKFNESVECHIRLGIDVKKADQMVRSTVDLPEGTGKTVRVAVIAKGDKEKEAVAAGAVLAGGDELIERIQKEPTVLAEFDVLVATPDMMAALAKVARVLGPKGLMPNPKAGTVTAAVGETVKALQGGKVEFRADKQGIVHVGIGKRDFTETQLLKNFSALYDAILRNKPSGAKGTFVKSVTLSSTMGPGIPVDTTKLATEIKEYLN